MTKVNRNTHSIRMIFAFIAAMIGVGAHGGQDHPKLEAIARAELRKSNLSLTPEADVMIKERLRVAEAEVNQMPKWRDAAENGVRDFMDFVIYVARSQKADVITVGILKEAEQRRCPIYPWCWKSK